MHSYVDTQEKNLGQQHHYAWVGLEYHIGQNAGGGKLQQTERFRISVKKMLASLNF